MNDIYIPKHIQKLVKNHPFHLDDIGHSGSQVLIFEVSFRRPLNIPLDNEIFSFIHNFTPSVPDYEISSVPQ